MGNIDYKKSHREKGLCLFCSNKAEPFSAYCKEHRETHRISSLKYKWANIYEIRKKDRKLKEKRILEGKCSHCGKPLDKGWTNRICANCSSNTFFLGRWVRIETIREKNK